MNAADDDQQLLREAVRCDALAQQALLRGDVARSRALFREAAERYRASWEATGEGSRAFGRLIGLLKSSLLAGHGDGGHAAAYVRRQLGDGASTCDSPPACYALALALLAQGDDEAAAGAIDGMRAGDAAFARAADALAALAAADGAAYATAVEAVVADFAAREQHLTGVAFADTAVMLERLAAPRGIAARPASALMPVLG